MVDFALRAVAVELKFFIPCSPRRGSKMVLPLPAAKDGGGKGIVAFGNLQGALRGWSTLRFAQLQSN